MKLSIVLSLLTLWVFALVAPSIITIVEKSETTFVFNLNEEEQKESHGVDSDQKQLNRHLPVSFFLNGPLNGSIIPDSAAHMPNPLFEVFLPPPKVYSAFLPG